MKIKDEIKVGKRALKVVERVAPILVMVVNAWIYLMVGLAILMAGIATWFFILEGVEFLKIW